MFINYQTLVLKLNEPEYFCQEILFYQYCPTIAIDSHNIYVILFKLLQIHILNHLLTIFFLLIVN